MSALDPEVRRIAVNALYDAREADKVMDEAAALVAEAVLAAWMPVMTTDGPWPENVTIERHAPPNQRSVSLAYPNSMSPPAPATPAPHGRYRSYRLVGA